MTQHVETKRSIPRTIQAIGVWLLAGTLVLAPTAMWLIHRYVEPTTEVDGWLVYRTWPENVRVLHIAMVFGFVAVVMILIGAALRLSRRTAA